MGKLRHFEIALALLLYSACCFGEEPSQQQQCGVDGVCSNNAINDDGSPSSSGGNFEIDTQLGEVPVIDVSALMDPEAYSAVRWDETAEAVSRACEEWGFFQVWSLVDAMHALGLKQGCPHDMQFKVLFKLRR